MKKFIRKLILLIILLDLILSYSIIQPQVYAKLVTETLESKYSLADIIPENTKIRNQMQTPWCIDFASLATLETTLGMQDRYLDNTAKEYDFSEEHMAYSTQDSSFKDEKTNKMGLHKNVNEGSTIIAIQEYFTNGMGVVSEKDYPFDNSTGNIDISKLNKPIAATVLDTFMFPQLSIKSTTEFSSDKISDLIMEMKSYIKNYGGITATLATGGANKNKYINWSNNSLNNPENISIRSLDHAVCIIGWDDNYSKDNFNTNYKPKNNGAWIVKNSWGNIVELGDINKLKEEVFNQSDESIRKQYNINSSNDITDEILIYVLKELFTGLTNIRIVNGVAYGDRDSQSSYMYISYETPSIYLNNMGVTRAELGKNYDNLYQYDEFGPTKRINITNTSVYMANVFKRDSSKNEKLTRVSIYSPKMQEYQIYVNPNNSNKTSKDIKQVSVNGNKKTVILDSGFHTLELDEPLELTGDSFVVVVKASNNNNDDSQISVETKCSSEEDPEGLLFNVEVGAGQSFFSIDDNLKENNWTDMLNLKLSDGTAIPSNANIKAYTKEYAKENENNNNTAENNTTENNTAENNTAENNTTKNNTTEYNTIEENAIKEQNRTIDNTYVNNNSKNNNTVGTSKTNSENNNSNYEKNSTKSDLDAIQTKLKNNKYVTTSPNLMQTSASGKDLTVATKKIPQTGENRAILYVIIFISIIASVLFIKYYKINKIMKS